MNVVPLWVSAVLLVVDCRGCPTHCLCYRWRSLRRTDCVRRNLFNTFVGFPPETQVLDLSHNVISILHGNEFLDANLRQLTDLRLSNNRLHRIDKLSFNGLELLENVDLSFNSLEYFPPTAFEHNPNLRVLNVSHNPLGLNKDRALLSTAPALQVLDVSHCLLRFVDVRWFLGLQRLRVLNVSHNHATKIRFDALEQMPKLRYLDVSKNDLPCDEGTTELLRRLVIRGIQFQAACRGSQAKVTDPAALTTESDRPEETPSHRRRPDDEKVTATASRGEQRFVDLFAQLLQSIPPLYAVLCGVQLGMLLGAFSAYFCLRKATRGGADVGLERTEPPRIALGGSDDLTLIPLNTPPGTPPSPYRSRLAFPSTFSLPST